MYLGGFYWFTNFWKSLPQITRFLAEKPHFFADSAKKMVPELRTKRKISQNILIRLLQFFFYMIFVIFRNFLCRGLLIFAFFVFLWDPEVAKRAIFRNFFDICQKMALFETSGSHKKNQNAKINNPIHKKFLNMTKIM